MSDGILHSEARGVLTYLSVCSGIEAATIAWSPLGWKPVAFAEIDPFPSAVLKHHYPGVPNWGDITKFREWPDATFDVLVGGTPCQSFSVAGLRAGLADPRGNLALTFLAIADRYRPEWVVWENVPGVLSSVSHIAPDPRPPAIDLDGPNGPADGSEVVVCDEYDADESHAFGCLLAGFSELGYYGAYGTLDAQYFHLAQRRARVFAVFHRDDWHRAAAVLFDRTSLSGDPAPRREAGQGLAAGPTIGAAGGRNRWLGNANEADGLVAYGGNNTSGPIDVATAVRAHGGPHQDFESETFIAHALRASGFDASEDGTGRGIPLVAHAFDARQSDVVQYGDQTGALDTDGHSIAMVFDAAQITSPTHRRRPSDVAGALNGNARESVASTRAVRRLTPDECEALQGFPRGYTDIPYRGKRAADGPRYKALGNSMAVPVVRWLGDQIHQVEGVTA